MKLVPVMSMCLLVVAAACGKKDKPEPTPPEPTGSATMKVTVTTGSAAPPAPSAPAAPGDGCAAGAYKAPSGAFCIDAAGYTAKDESKNGTFSSVGFRSDNGPDVDVNWDSNASPTDYNDRVKVIEDNSKLKGVTLDDHGDLPGGGKWVLYSNKSGPKKQFTNHTFESVAKGKKSNFNCEVVWGDDTPATAKAVTICKSLHPLM